MCGNEPENPADKTTTKPMNPNPPEQEQDLDVIQGGALEAMERASIDVQIATAKKWPRTISVVKAQMLSFATLDRETAAGCFFTLPPRKGGDGKPIQGPSIRMAEIAISSYQNIRAGARVIADDGKVITAQGVCHDLQNNVCVSVEVRRRVTTRDGRRFSEDMVVMTGNAACSLALRNATFRVVPLALVKPVYEAAKMVAVGDAKTLVTRRADALAHFTKMGVEKARIFHALGVKTLEDVGLEHLEILIGYANAIKDGDSSVDEVFPAVKEATAEPQFAKPATAPVTPAAPVSVAAATPAPAEPVAATPVSASVEPTPPASSAASLAQTPVDRDIKMLGMLLKQAGFTELHLMNHFRANGLDETLLTLKDVGAAKPSVLRTACEPWSVTLAALKAAAQGGAQ